MYCSYNITPITRSLTWLKCQWKQLCLSRRPPNYAPIGTIRNCIKASYSLPILWMLNAILAVLQFPERVTYVKHTTRVNGHCGHSFFFLFHFLFFFSFFHASSFIFYFHFSIFYLHFLFHFSTFSLSVFHFSILFFFHSFITIWPFIFISPFWPFLYLIFYLFFLITSFLPFYHFKPL